jgi:predicted RNA-binding Zn-ribbon protein involved in translation (DUF1610 family)
MRLEEVAADTVGELTSEELLNLRERANQLDRAQTIWKDQISKRMVGVDKPLSENALLQSYQLITAEIAKRKLQTTPTGLDRRLVARRLRGLDVSDMPSLIISKGAVVITGEFVVNPRRAPAVDVFIAGDEFGNDTVPAEIEKRMAELLALSTDKPVRVVKGEIGPGPAVVVYDLVLVPRTVTTELRDLSEIRKAVVENDDTTTNSSEPGPGAGNGNNPTNHEADIACPVVTQLEKARCKKCGAIGAVAHCAKCGGVDVEYQLAQAWDGQAPLVAPVYKAEWDDEYKKALPDSAFLWIDENGDRHLPYKNKEGQVDPTHLRAAAAAIGGARTGQPMAVPAAVKTKVASLLADLKKD